jgi:pimeloyl-ACP methyl ester carboxylesterase
MSTPVSGAELFDRFCRPQTRDVAAKDTAILASAAQFTLPHQQVLELPPRSRAAIDLCAYRWGNPAQPKVLLAHGWEFQAGRMAAFVQPLLDAGYCVLALDFPAHGRSPGEFSTMADFAAAIDAVIRAAGPLHAIVGHSFGAQSSAWLLATRGSRAVQRLVMIAAGASVEYLVRMSPQFASLSAAELEPIFAAFEQRMGAPMAAFDVHTHAPAIRVPTLLVHDTRDLLIPASTAADYARLIPGARLLQTSGLGHRAIIRAPEVVAAVCAFIAEAAAPT